MLWYHKDFCIVWFLHVMKDYASSLMEYFLHLVLGISRKYLKRKKKERKATWAVVCSALAQSFFM